MTNINGFCFPAEFTVLHLILLTGIFYSSICGSFIRRFIRDSKINCRTVVRKETMFYSCLSILILLVIMIFCITLSIIDLESYNFGLYIVLLCIVGTMLACALCVANPNACQNPTWYTNLCMMIQEINPNQSAVGDPSKSAGLEMNGLRSRMLALHQQAIPPDGVLICGGDSKLPVRQESRATIAMLAPAVHIMHQVWRGMAWVAEGIDEDEEPTKNHDEDLTEQGVSNSESQTTSYSAAKKLSTIAESSSASQIFLEHEMEETSGEFTSSNDIIV